MAEFTPNLNVYDVPSNGSPDQQAWTNINSQMPQQLSTYYCPLLQQTKTHFTTTQPPYCYFPPNPFQVRPAVVPRTRFGMSQTQNHHYRIGSSPIEPSLMVKRVEKPETGSGTGFSLQENQSEGLNRFWVGGFMRESGGTGVFLPRVAAATTNVANKQSLRNGEEKHQGKKAGVVVVKHHETVLAEMGLPKEWTY